MDDLSITGFEIDFFPVGEGARSGDAIVVRFGDLDGPRDAQRVVVVDGGFTDDGEAIVTHLKEVVGTTRVDLVISTHPDQDHITGLTTIVEQLEVGVLCMHLPWEHTDDIARMFHDGRVTDNSVSEKLRNELDGARILGEAAIERGVRIVEPFAGDTGFGSALTVLGPTREYYDTQLLNFRTTPDRRRENVIVKALEGTRSIAERFDLETLTDAGDTSAENNTSVVTLWNFAGRYCLLTGDAGIDALDQAADQLDAMGVARPLAFVQVPHHGSRHNVGPSVLDRILGPRLPAQEKRTTAFVSVSPGADRKHPAPSVTNAFLRRGAPVVSTKDHGQIRHGHNAPARPGWGPVASLPLIPEVEA